MGYRTSLVTLVVALIVAGSLGTAAWHAIDARTTPHPPKLKASRHDATPRPKQSAGVKVRDDLRWKMPAPQGNGATIPARDIAIVDDRPGADLAATARKCLADHRLAGGTTNCYVFASQEAYEAQNRTADLEANSAIPKGTYGVAAGCWAIYATQPASAKPTVSDMRPAPQTWDAQGCPASWKGTQA